jgi:hypothetical protein
VTVNSVLGRDLIFLITSVSLLLWSLNGIKTGSTVLFVGKVTRSGDGYLFWIGIWMKVVIGVTGLSITFYDLVHWVFRL